MRSGAIGTMISWTSWPTLLFWSLGTLGASSSKLSASEHQAAADVHEELLRSSLPRFMQKAKRPLSLVWTKVKEHHCILGVVFFLPNFYAVMEETLFSIVQDPVCCHLDIHGLSEFANAHFYDKQHAQLHGTHASAPGHRW